MAYGLLSHDLFLAVSVIIRSIFVRRKTDVNNKLFELWSVLQSPNLVGSPLGILQLILYCIYRKRGGVKQPQKWDLETHSEKSEQHLEVIEANTVDKPIQYLKVDEEKGDLKANQQQLQLVVTDAIKVSFILSHS